MVVALHVRTLVRQNGFTRVDGQSAADIGSRIVGRQKPASIGTLTCACDRTSAWALTALPFATSREGVNDEARGHMTRGLRR